MHEDLFEVVTTPSGARSIRHKVLNETMHNPVGPWAEAHGLYVHPSRLAERIFSEGQGHNISHEPLVLYDIGLGAGTNAVAAIHCRLGENSALATNAQGRQLIVVSFEKDLRLLEFTLSHCEEFPYLLPYKQALNVILEQGHWMSPCGQVHWQLHKGDFLATVMDEKLAPDLIFHDPYSPKVNDEMWSAACFRKLREKCQNKKTLLLTYSIATPIRGALLLAGFYVGHGPRSGLKHETTQAATDPSLLSSPLGERWMKRWEKSHTKYPLGLSYEETLRIEEAIWNHPQFLRPGSLSNFRDSSVLFQKVEAV